MMRPLIAMLLGYIAVGASAQDTCVTSLGFAQGRASTIGLSVGTDVPADVVQSAVEMWNTCSDYATGFPSFVTAANGDITVSIAFAETGATRGCGQFHPVVNGSNQVTSGTITLFGGALSLSSRSIATVIQSLTTARNSSATGPFSRLGCERGTASKR
ncbi:MAG TPA: hypothetical protein VF883_16025 [Thermoanaerobaculia bacterium]|jgi:hypothetical protein